VNFGQIRLRLRQIPIFRRFRNPGSDGYNLRGDLRRRGNRRFRERFLLRHKRYVRGFLRIGKRPRIRRFPA
jgi:hypothetical protein